MNEVEEALAGRIGGKGMREDTEMTEAGRHYAAAYKTHYETKDLRKAFELYKGVMVDHPNTKEAGYSKSQIQNIVNAVVPKEERLESQMDLASAVLDHVD